MSSSTDLSPGPRHLNTAGCVIKVSGTKGRGVYASKPISRNTTIEISPVLLFSKSEYEEHGKHTVVDHYTFVWRDGRMALALGLGSLFNHADHPNISYTLDTLTDSIRYVTARDIKPEEELCIFYGHKLWFSPEGAISGGDNNQLNEEEDGWGGLSAIDDNKQTETTSWVNPFTSANPEGLISAEDLPFIRYKPPPEEEEPESIRTIRAWVVDVPDQKLITTLLKWLKQADLDAPELAHLKRIRKQNDTVTFLLASQTAFPLDPPSLPHDFTLPQPYLHTVPVSSASTPIQLTLKTALWPTIYTPRRKDEEEKWSRGRAAWAWHAMHKTIQAAVEAHRDGELPIAAHVPASYEETQSMGNHNSELSPGSLKEFVARDTRKSSGHPLRHAVMNVIRTVADQHASTSTPSSRQIGPDALDLPVNSSESSVTNGSNYLLTSLTLFTTHEPCVMCSMALLHSRVKEVIYLLPMSRTGACGSIACLPTLKGVNHRYSIGQWKQNKVDGDSAGQMAVRAEGLDSTQIDTILDIGTTTDA